MAETSSENFFSQFLSEDERKKADLGQTLLKVEEGKLQVDEEKKEAPVSEFAISPAREALSKIPGIGYTYATEISPTGGTSPIPSLVKPMFDFKDTIQYKGLSQDKDMAKSFSNNLAFIKDTAKVRYDNLTSEEKQRLSKEGVLDPGMKYPIKKGMNMQQIAEIINKLDGRQFVFDDNTTKDVDWSVLEGDEYVFKGFAQLPAVSPNVKMTLLDVQRKTADEQFFRTASPTQMLFKALTDPDSKRYSSLVPKYLPVYGNIFAYGDQSIDNLLETMDESLAGDDKYASGLAKLDRTGQLFLRKLGSRFNNILQGIFTGSTFVWGEGMEFMKNKLNSVGGLQIESFGGLETPEERDAAVTKIFPNASKDFKMMMNAKGFYDFSAEDAKRVLYFNNNVGERAFELGAESITFGAGITKYVGLRAAKEGKQFAQYLKDHGDKFDHLGDAFEGFIKKQHMLDKNGLPIPPRANKWYNNLFEKLQRDRLTNATQFWQAGLPSAMRLEVKSAETMRNNMIKAMRKEQPLSDFGMPFKLDTVRDKVLWNKYSEASKAVADAKAFSGVAPVLRDLARAESRVLLYGAAGGQIMQDFGTDPALGEILGIIYGGILTPLFDLNSYTSLLNIDSNVTRVYKQFEHGALRLLEEMPGSPFQRGELVSETMSFAGQRFTEDFVNSLLATDANSPMVQEVVKRVAKLGESKDALIKAGLSEEAFNMTLSKLTGLTILNAFDSAYAEVLSAGSTLNHKTMKDVQEVNIIRNKLNQEIRGVISKLAPELVDPKQASEVSRWATGIRLGLKKSEKIVNDVDNALAFLSQNQQSLMIDNVLAKLKGKNSEDAKALQKKIDDSIDMIFEYSQIKLGPDADAKTIYEDTLRITSEIESRIATQADELIAEFDKSVDLKLFQDDFAKLPEVRKKAITLAGEGATAADVSKQIKKLSKTALTQKLNKLLAVSVEARRAEVSARGGLIYGNFDNMYPTARGDASEVFSKIVLANIDPTKPLRNMTESGIKPADLDKLVESFNFKATKILDDFEFDRREIVDEMKQLLGSGAKTSKDAYLVHHIMTNSQSEFYNPNIRMTINFQDLYKIKSAVSKQSYKLSKLPTGVPKGASSVYADLLEDVTGVYETFMMKDKNNKAVPVPNLKQISQELSSKYKSEVADVIYEGSIFVDWLKGDRTIGISKFDPTGVKYKNDPSTWIDMNKIAEDSDGVFGEAFAKAFGEFKDGNYIIDAEKNKGLKSVLEFKLKKWIQEQRTAGDTGEGKTITQINKGINNILRNFYIKDNSKKPKFFIDPEEYVGSNGAFSIKEAAKRDPNIKKIQKIADDQLNEAFQGTGTDAFKIRQKVKKEQAHINNLLKLVGDIELPGSGRISNEKSFYEQIIQREDGMVALQQLKEQAVKGGMSGDDFDQATKRILGKYISDITTKRTESEILGLDKDVGTIEVYDTDFDKLGEIISENNSFLRKIFGDEQVDTLENIASYMKLYKAENSFDSFAMRGIPRALSAESYMSRLYSINRGVISPKYVATEIALQHVRQRKMNLLNEIINNPEVAKGFEAMVVSGKPLKAEANKRFFASMLLSVARYGASESDFAASDLYPSEFIEKGKAVATDTVLPFTQKTIEDQMKFLGIGKGDIRPFADKVKNIQEGNQQ